MKLSHILDAKLFSSPRQEFVELRLGGPDNLVLQHLSSPKIPSHLNWHDEVESLHRQRRCLRSFMHSGCSLPTCSSPVVGLKPFLRHQLTLALRQKRPRIRLRGSDRALLVWMVRLWPSLLDTVHVVQPETILRWHRARVRAFWRWKSRNRAGRPKIDRELRALIRRMSMENSLWGSSRIHGELLKLGYEVAQSTVSKYMARGGKPPSQSWKTFLRNHAEAIAAVDMCIVPTVTFERLFAFLVLGHGRRQLLWFEVTRHPTAAWLARQITEAFPWASAPAYLVRDNDRAYGYVFTTRVTAMGIRDRPISPGSPWQNGIVERLIGTLRRECLNHIVIFGEVHLRRILCAYAVYYNQTRTHLALNKDCPFERPIQHRGSIVTIPVLAGLHHQYARM
jgi:transposase InsO family protein